MRCDYDTEARCYRLVGMNKMYERMSGPTPHSPLITHPSIHSIATRSPYPKAIQSLNHSSSSSSSRLSPAFWSASAEL